jgi:DNA-binding response OmpR family regulator
MKILLMEDDVVLSELILDHLRESWEVDHAYGSDEVYEWLQNSKYDLFIFDINVVGTNGLELLKELRDYNDKTPAIIITAYNDTAYLKKGFENGADDYIKKPFELEELDVRIRHVKKLFSSEKEVFLGDGIIYNLEQKKIATDTKDISLSSKDCKILNYFIEHKKRVITNDELIQNIWDFENIPSDATIRSHIRTLREIIGKDKIKTVRGVGYIYE